MMLLNMSMSHQWSMYCALWWKIKLWALSILKNLQGLVTLFWVWWKTMLYNIPVGTVFPLDGAPPHFSHPIHTFLNTESDYCMGRGEPIPWSPCSPDLPRLDFWFWEFVKDTVYCEKVQNVNELHSRISRATYCATNEMVANTWKETECHLDVCCATKGAHMEI